MGIAFFSESIFMETYSISKAQSESDLERLYSVIKELRKELTLPDFISLYKLAHESNGYEIVALECHGKVLAVMGYRILYDFVHGKHIYIDDLVSIPEERSKGFGRRLLEYAEKLAIDLECNGLRLCAGIDNELGKKFYEKNNWKLRAVVYKKKLSP